MTREDITRMAREAGIVVTGEAVWKLCELVAAAEREACARLCESLYGETPKLEQLDCATAIREREKAKQKLKK